MSVEESPSPVKNIKDDPYKEFEIYLEEAENEIKEVFADGKTSITAQDSLEDSGTRYPITNNGKSMSSGVKALVQLEAILHGLSWAQVEAANTRTAGRGQPSSRLHHSSSAASPGSGNYHLDHTYLNECVTSGASNSSLREAFMAIRRDQSSENRLSGNDRNFYPKEVKQSDEMLPNRGSANEWSSSQMVLRDGCCRCGHQTNCQQSPGFTHVNIDALSLWADNLACEMNNMTVEESVKDVDGDGQQDLVQWLLTDLKDKTTNGNRNTDNYVSGKRNAAQKDRSSFYPGVSNPEEVASSNVHRKFQIENYHSGERLVKRPNGSTDSDSEVFVDAPGCPHLAVARSAKRNEIQTKGRSRLQTRVDVKIDSPVRVVEVMVRSSSPNKSQRLSVEYSEEVGGNSVRIENLKDESSSVSHDRVIEGHVVSLNRLVQQLQVECASEDDERRRNQREIKQQMFPVKCYQETNVDDPTFSKKSVASDDSMDELKEDQRETEPNQQAEENDVNFVPTKDEISKTDNSSHSDLFQSRLSSTTSTLSSSGSQMKPEDVQDFLRKVETSIWESKSLKRRQMKIAETANSFEDDVFLPPNGDATKIAARLSNAATQTSPTLSRSSSLAWALSENDTVIERSREESEEATAGSLDSILSVSCSSIGALSALSVSHSTSSFSDQETTDQSNARDMSGVSKQKRGAVKCHQFMEGSIPRLKAYTPLPLSDEEVWVRREDVESQTMQNTPPSANTTSGDDFAYLESIETLLSDSSVSKTPSPPAVRGTSSDSNISARKTSPSSATSADGSSFTIPPSNHRPLLLPIRKGFVEPLSLPSSPESPLKGPATAPILPSPPLMGELSMLDIHPKSSSAPMLDVHNLSLPATNPSSQIPPTQQSHIKVIPPPRSQSVKELAELEAVEACKWLRAAGFPQYAQMFEDMQFPINVTAVQKDHYFLDANSLQSLFRRLNALNKCARMRLDNIPRKSGVEDSDEEEQCALSENWTFQRQSRRWSRIPSCLEPCVSQLAKTEIPVVINGQNDGNVSIKNGQNVKNAVNHSHDSPLGGPTDEEKPAGSKSSERTSESATPPPDGRCNVFRRTGSERLKDGARAFMRRMESLKTRRSKRRNREAVIISGPQVMDTDEMEQRMQQLACVDLSTTDGQSTSNIADDEASLSASDVSQTSTPTIQTRQPHSRENRRLPSDSEVPSAIFSDPECSPPMWRTNKDVNKLIIEHLAQEDESDGREVVNFRTGSINLGRKSLAGRDGNIERTKPPVGQKNQQGEMRTSLYDNVPPSLVCNKNYKVSNQRQEGASTENSFVISDGKNMHEEKTPLHIGVHLNSDSGSSTSMNVNSTNSHDVPKSEECVKNSDKVDLVNQSGVTLPNSANLSNPTRKVSLVSLSGPRLSSCAVSINTLSVGQLMVLRKLSLLKLTALMEHYSPSNRSGWNWIMPKFIKRMKVPDYKDKVVFGVPLSLIHQRTGQPLPPSIQAAITFLKKNAMDSVGIFRKSGVRSRIQKLKNMCEANPSSISYEGQQTYDVADMLKQYFRELPEALLTNKMSETFIGIYQYIPEELRLEALQSVIMMIPEENREILQKLLCFLCDVSLHAHENQMTASNLAVCFAPSLFHMHCPRSTSSSPRRRKTAGVPDQKELNENRAAHDCLTQMIRDCKKFFTVPEDTLFQCRFSYVDDSQPLSLNEFGNLSGSELGNWRTYVSFCIQNLLKECREKTKGWVSVSTHENVDLSFKKVGDGNPLRLWKTSVEVEAPPVELLNRVLRERHVWDEHLLKWNVISKLDNCSELFHYVCNSMAPLPARDYCILRSWRTDLPKGTCVLVEVSVSCPEVPLLLGDVRGTVLLSRYLIEPCGSGKSRITHVSRVDTRGRSPEWYNRVYGHISALHLLRIGMSFRHNTEGPESKV